jgi:hypothetical protein
MVVRMVPMVSPLSLRELYLPLSLRGDEKNIGGHKKKGRGIGELLEQEKSMASPNMTVLWG